MIGVQGKYAVSSSYFIGVSGLIFGQIREPWLAKMQFSKYGYIILLYKHIVEDDDRVSKKAPDDAFLRTKELLVLLYSMAL